MSTLTDDLKRAAGMMEVAVQGLEQVQKLTHVGGDQAAEALIAIEAGLAAITAGFDGSMTPDEVRQQLASLTTSIGANDGEADANLANKKFDTSTTP